MSKIEALALAITTCIIAGGMVASVQVDRVQNESIFRMEDRLAIVESVCREVKP